MKVIEEIFVKGKSRKEVISLGKKKYSRTASSNGIDWRRYKTNHQVNKLEFENLENEYKKCFPIHFSPDPHFGGVNMYASGSTMFHEFINKNGFKSYLVPLPVKNTTSIEDDDERRRIERGLVEASKDGTALLMGVKYVKEQTGWGLKDSKDFVDKFFERQKKNLTNNL